MFASDKPSSEADKSLSPTEQPGYPAGGPASSATNHALGRSEATWLWPAMAAPLERAGPFALLGQV